MIRYNKSGAHAICSVKPFGDDGIVSRTNSFRTTAHPDLEDRNSGAVGVAVAAAAAASAAAAAAAAAPGPLPPLTTTAHIRELPSVCLFVFHETPGQHKGRAIFFFTLSSVSAR